MNILHNTSKDFEDYIKTYKESLNKALSTLDELEKAINYTRCCTELKALKNGKNGEGMDLVRGFNKGIIEDDLI